MHATTSRSSGRAVATGPRQQRGAIAIIVGIAMVAMIGAVGLAIDGGRLYLSKTETQNAADACALGAAYELSGVPASIPLASFPRAEAAGKAVAKVNRTGIQSAAVTDANITVTFSTSLTGGAWVSAAAATAESRYVRCTIKEAGITPYFMQVLGMGANDVNSMATATLVPSQGICTGLPVGLCTPSPAAANFGLTPGQWLKATYSTSGQMTGNFGWIDYSPPGGGESELAGMLTGPGACSTSVGMPVGDTGGKTALRTAWNTRFGIYAPSAPSTGPGSAAPDYTGYAYYTANWDRATKGPALPDFVNVRRTAHTAYGASVNAGNTLTGLAVGPAGSTVLQSATLAERGANRRIAPSPIIDCAGFATGQTVKVLEWGCALMLHPINQSGPMEVTIEYIGLAKDPTSPCKSMGFVGDDTSTGPRVPALVQ